MPNDRIATVRSLYDAFAAGDGATLAALIGDTHWIEAAGMPYGGNYRGLAEVAANVFGPIGRDIADFTARPDEILPVGDTQVLALGIYRGTGGAGPLDARFAHLYRVADDGAITDFEQFADTHLFRQALG